MQKTDSKYNRMARASFSAKLRAFIYDLSREGRSKFTIDDFHQFKPIGDLTINEFVMNCAVPLHENLMTKTADEIHEKRKELITFLQYEYLCDFERILPIEEYRKLKDTKRCYYCGISEEEISILANQGKLFNIFNSRKLQISTKNSNKEYTPDNCVKICCWCKKAKVNEFSHDEFVQIAKGISSAWKKRLNER